MTHDPNKHRERKEWTLQMVHELLNEMEGFKWDDFQTAAYMLNQMGIPPCHLIAILREMEADGQLDPCSQCCSTDTHPR